MRAWRLEGLGGELRLRNVPDPEPGPGAVVVRVAAVTLMSYTKAYVEGRLPAYRAPAGPFTPGGNCVGTIESVGPGVWDLRPGQRVIASSLVTADEPVPEPARILLGVTSFGGASDRMQASWRDGTLAERALLPASCVTPVEDALAGMPPQALAVISRFAVPFGGLKRGRLAAGESLIVNGATGAYGSAAVLLAGAMGAGRVVAAGRNPGKLEALANLAGPAVATVIGRGAVEADATALREAAGGGAEMAFDMVGGTADPRSTLAALHALRQCGRLVLMGGMAADLPVPTLKLMLDGIEIIGNFMHPPSANHAVLALVGAGRLDLGAIRPCAYALSDLGEAMVAAESAGPLQAVVVMP